MKCRYCRTMAVYGCSLCGRAVCGEHTRLRTICHSCVKKTSLEHFIEKATLGKEDKIIKGFVNRFWGEEEQLTFDKNFNVTQLPAFFAKHGSEIMGLVSFAEDNDALIIVALGVLPMYQSMGIGKSLVEKVEEEARKLQKRKLLVSTSNDDLPALAFYQSLGFQIFEIKPNVIAEKHGEILKGICGLPIRDELRLQKNVCLGGASVGERDDFRSLWI